MINGRFRFNLLYVLLCGVLLSGCNVELFSELDERNANDILLVLNQEGIEASKTPHEAGQWKISVPEQSVQAALAATRRHALPRAQFVTLGDVFAKQGLIATPSEERQRYAFAVSQELANTLMQIDGVVVARVHPVIPLVDPLSDHISAPSAAVFIKHLNDADLAPMVPAIKNLVSQSIEGLTPSDVSLTFSSAAPLLSGPPPAQQSREQTEKSSLLMGGGVAVLGLLLWSLFRLLSSRAPSIPAKRPRRRTLLSDLSSLLHGSRVAEGVRGKNNRSSDTRWRDA